MLGSMCYRLFTRNATHHSTKAIRTQDNDVGSWAYSKQLTSRSYVATPSLPRTSSWPSLHDASKKEVSGSLSGLTDAKESPPYTHSYVKEGSEITYATIWHGLLPSRYPSILEQNTVSILKGRFDSHYPVWNHLSLSSKEQGFGRLAKGASLSDGSWNAAWDARPARWLHGRHSAWLLFGVRTSTSGAMVTPASPGWTKSLGNVKGISGSIAGTSAATSNLDSCNETRFESLRGLKQVYKNYRVTGIPSDGRCLFRAISHGACLRNGEPAPSMSEQQELADDLRSKVVNELIVQRNESEWFIEEDFDAYIKRMREPYVWGGEPELLMASHVLKMPITVLFFDQVSEGLISIAEYGSEYGTKDPVRILYHGFGHYDSVEILAPM